MFLAELIELPDFYNHYSKNLVKAFSVDFNLCLNSTIKIIFMVVTKSDSTCQFCTRPYAQQHVLRTSLD